MIEDGKAAEGIAILESAKSGRLVRETVLNQIAYGLLNPPARRAEVAPYVSLRTAAVPAPPALARTPAVRIRQTFTSAPAMRPSVAVA
jgi:hypothetical protein